MLGSWFPSLLLKLQNLCQRRPLGFGRPLQVFFPPFDGQDRNLHNLSNMTLQKAFFIPFDQEVITQGLDGRRNGFLWPFGGDNVLP